MPTSLSYRMYQKTYQKDARIPRSDAVRICSDRSTALSHLQGGVHIRRRRRRYSIEQIFVHTIHFFKCIIFYRHLRAYHSYSLYWQSSPSRPRYPQRRAGARVYRRTTYTRLSGGGELWHFYNIFELVPVTRASAAAASSGGMSSTAAASSGGIAAVSIDDVPDEELTAARSLTNLMR